MLQTRCSRDDAGGVAAEYAAMTGFIAGAVALAVSAFGTRVVGLIELL
jgi:Flp pilus assembly pilin Flp